MQAPSCCKELTPYLFSLPGLSLDQRPPFAIPLAALPLSPCPLQEAAKCGTQTRGARYSVGPGKLAEPSLSSTPPCLSLQHGMSLSQPGLSQESDPRLPIAPAPQEK